MALQLARKVELKQHDMDLPRRHAGRADHLVDIDGLGLSAPTISSRSLCRMSGRGSGAPCASDEASSMEGGSGGRPKIGARVSRMSPALVTRHAPFQEI